MYQYYFNKITVPIVTLAICFESKLEHYQRALLTNDVIKVQNINEQSSGLNEVFKRFSTIFGRQ